MTAIGQFVVAPDHPCLPGHFPGQPVVPAVVLLDEAMALALRDHRLVGFATVKFTRPVLPDEAVDVSAAPAANGRMAFACTVGGAPAIRGTALVA